MNNVLVFLKKHFIDKKIISADLVFSKEYKDLFNNIELNNAKDINEIPDMSLNLICLDHINSYDILREDISKWIHKLRDNGVMCGTNYNNVEVSHAVNQFTRDCNLELHVQGKVNRDWWFIKPMGINHLPSYQPPGGGKKRLRILALTWPTFDDEKRMMINARGDLVCPAIDGLTNELINLGHTVIYVNVFAEYIMPSEHDLKCLAMISGLPFHLWKDIKNKDFDLIWHACKDPTPEMALPYFKKIMDELNQKIPVLNNVEKLKDHTKRKYVTLLREKNVGAIILKDELKPFLNEEGKLDYQHKCFPPSQACYVTKDYYAIRLPLTNSNRRYGLFTPEGGITLKYQNTAKYPNAKKGLRNFFRVPYAAGKCLEGTMYYCPADVLCPKSGAAVIRESFSIPDMSAGTISAAMKELGVDIAHIEGVPAGFTIEIFDCNTFPSSAGETLTPFSQKIARRIEQVYNV